MDYRNALMWKGIPFFLALGIVTGLLSCRRTSPGAVELQKARQAIHMAQGWNVGVTVQLSSGQWVPFSLEKVECPNRRRIYHLLPERLVTGSQIPSPGWIAQEIWYDGDWLTLDAAGWNRIRGAQDTFPGKPAMTTCGNDIAMVVDPPLFSDLDSILENGEIRRGKLPVPQHENCTWWEVAPGPGAPARYSVCIDPQDHLPRVLRSREQEHDYVYSFSQWDATQVTLPDNVHEGMDVRDGTPASQ